MSAEQNVDASKRYEQVPAAEGPLEEHEVDSEYLCGLRNYRPCWMQKFATSRYFALVFGVLGIFQGALRTYLVGTLSTVEKRFSMSGRLSSIVMIADNISPILATLVLAVWLRRTSKPNWVAGGMLLSVLGAVSCCLPYGIHGKGTHLLGDTGQPGNALRTQFCGDANVDVLCADGTGDGVSLGPLIFLFVGNFLNGLGGTAYYVIGTTYMDDNVKKKNSALYFGSVFAFRLMGPVVGFFLSSFCLSYPEDPHENAEMDQDDPRWIGAWWMGYLIIGTGIFLSTLPMFFFPKKIRPKAEANKIDTTEAKDKSIKDDAKETWQVLHRLSRNPIYVFRTIATITAVFGLAGYYISFPKYTEHQFSQTASQASLIAGPTYIVSNVIGTILGSVFVHKVKPRPRIVAIHGLVVTLISIIGILALMAVSCGSIQYPVIRDDKERLTIENRCSIDCDCSTSIHHPVCDLDTGTQYFSACFAGCKPEPFNNTEYRDCVCLQSEPGVNKFSRGHVKNGKCEQDCMRAMMAFAGVLFFIQVALSSANVGSTLLLLRAVDPKDKSIALTTNAFFLNILAFIPYPLIYGAVIDASCIVWEDRCGESGACWIYDLQKLRYLIHGVTTLVLVVSCLFQGAVIYYSKTMKNFYDEDETNPPAARAAGEPLRGSLYAFRLMGPVVGFFLSSLCLSYPEDLNDKPDMRVEDPRWIGAWWVGYLVIGMGILLSVLPMFFFPKKIRPKAAANKVDIAGQEDKGFKADVKETLQALNRLFRNPVYVLRIFASISAYIALAGYYISFPKYTEHQFSQTASRASLFAGPTYIVSNVIGTILGAIFVHKVKPSPRVVAALNVFVTVVSIGGIVALMLISCGSIHYPVVRNSEERLTIENSCTADCDCSTSIHHPVCDPNTDTQYFSACFAGCLPEAPNQTEFRDCRCLQSERGESQFSIGQVKNGKCEQDCFDAMMAFAGVVFFMQVVLSTSHVGSTLLFLRAIEPKDKSVALTMNSFIMNMFAFIPYPLIYGAVIDASCLVWEDRCGERGACWIYDLQKLRYLIHGVTTVLLVISAVFQCGVVYYSKIIKNFYDEGETDPPEALAGAPDNSKEGPEIHELDVQLPEPARQRKTSTESWEFQNFNKMVNVTDSL